MAKITTIEQLREAIRDLEHQNYVNEQHMRNRVAQMADRLKPANIVRNLFSNLFTGNSEAAGIATSFLVKKFFKKGLSAK
jgi:hypothetical protein